MKRKLLFFGETQAPVFCGVGDYVGKLTEGLSGSEFEPVRWQSLCERQEGEAEKSSTRPVSGTFIDWRLHRLPRLWCAVKSLSPQLVHIHFPSQGYYRFVTPWLVPLICRMQGIAVVVTLHEQISLLRVYRLLLVRLAGAKVVVVRARYMAEAGRLQRCLLEPLHPSFIQSGSTLPKARLRSPQKKALREGFGNPTRLLVFFGFIYPAKGAHRLLELGLSQDDHVVFAGPTPDQEYLARIKQDIGNCTSGAKVSFLGEMPAPEAAALISVCDALVLPFETGGGEWNTTILAGVLNNTFVLTTSASRRGYDKQSDVYYAEPGNTAEMQRALQDRIAGSIYPERSNDIGEKEGGQGNEGHTDGGWARVVREHVCVYRQLLSPGRDQSCPA